MVYLKSNHNPFVKILKLLKFTHVPLPRILYNTHLRLSCQPATKIRYLKICFLSTKYSDHMLLLRKIIQNIFLRFNSPISEPDVFGAFAIKSVTACTFFFYRVSVFFLSFFVFVFFGIWFSCRKHLARRLES